MLLLEKLSRKAHYASLESRQNLSSLVNRQKFSVATADQKIINDLRKDGVHVTNLAHLFGDDDSDDIAKVFARAATDLEGADKGILPSHLQKKTSSVDMEASAILAKYPELFFLCLSKRILNLVESYLGMRAAYHGVALRRSLNDGVEIGPRLWHKDCEDFHVVRIIVYLNDVTEDGGPFEYLPRTYGLNYGRLKTVEDRLTNEDMLKIVPEIKMRPCHGKAGTVIICDSANTFHHEKLQVTQQRSVAMYGFSSRLPKNPEIAQKHFPAEVVKDQLNTLLSSSQLPYVYGWRR